MITTFPRFAEMARSARERMVAVRRRIHSRPELSNGEELTTELVAEEASGADVSVERIVGGSGLVATLDWGIPGACVAVRAELDALPIKEVDRGQPYRSRIDGVHHACGHDGHVAMALGAAEILRSAGPLPGSVRLIFQPAEENPPEGGAARMIEHGAIEGVDAVLGLHLWPDLPTGEVGIRPGSMFSASDRFRVLVTGRGGHAAQPHRGADAIVAASHVIQAIQTVVARRVDQAEALVISVGTIRGGARYNVLCDRVELEGTIRTVEPHTRETLPATLNATARAAAAIVGADASVDVTYGYPPLVNDTTVVGEVRRIVAEVYGDAAVVELPRTILGGEDFGRYLERIPGACVLIGCGNEARGLVQPLHSAEFDFDEDALPIGAAVMAGWCYARLKASEPK